MKPDDPPAGTLLAPDEPPAFRVFNPDAASPLVLVCDHACNRIPRRLKQLGLPAQELDRHIAWDLGAAEITERLSRRLDAVAVLCQYSRLVIDCNRRLDHETSVTAESDGALIPGNLHPTDEDIRRRRDEIFHPYHTAVAEAVAARRQGDRVPAIVSVHSFTPEMGGIVRPWHVGILWSNDPRLPLPLLELLRARSNLAVGDNQPYSGREHYGYTIEVHAGGAGLANALIEIREDQIRNAAGIALYAGLLGDALETALQDDNLYRVEHYE